MSAEKPNYNEVKQIDLNTIEYLPEPSVKSETLYSESATSSSGSKDFIIGAVVGGVIGAAAALFLAPKAGKELRSEVKVQADQLKTKSADLTATVKEKAAPVVDKVKSYKSSTPPLDDGTAFQGDDEIDMMQTIDNTIAEYEADPSNTTFDDAVVVEENLDSTNPDKKTL